MIHQHGNLLTFSAILTGVDAAADFEATIRYLVEVNLNGNVKGSCDIVNLVEAEELF